MHCTQSCGIAPEGSDVDSLRVGACVAGTLLVLAAERFDGLDSRGPTLSYRVFSRRPHMSDLNSEGDIAQLGHVGQPVGGGGYMSCALNRAPQHRQPSVIAATKGEGGLLVLADARRQGYSTSGSNTAGTSAACGSWRGRW